MGKGFRRGHQKEKECSELFLQFLEIYLISLCKRLCSVLERESESEKESGTIQKGCGRIYYRTAEADDTLMNYT